MTSLTATRKEKGNRFWASFTWARLTGAGSATGMNLALGLYEKFQPDFQDDKRSKILGTSSGAKFEKQSNMAKHKNFNFRAYHNFGNS